MGKRALKISNYFFLDMNPVVKFLIISDTVIVGAAGLLGPIFALFIEGYIDGGNEAVAGIAAGVFLFSKSILQIPIAHIIDKIRGEKDDFWFLFIFSILMGVAPLLYLYINTPLQLYIVEFMLGVLTAFTYPSFMAIYTRHIDKTKEGTEWSVYFTLTDIVSALFAVVGGYLAATSGFHILIIVVVVMSVLGAFLLWPIRPYIKGR